MAVVRVGALARRAGSAEERHLAWIRLERHPAPRTVLRAVEQPVVVRRLALVVRIAARLPVSLVVAEGPFKPQEDAVAERAVEVVALDPEQLRDGDKL